MSHYSENPAHCRVDIFKPSGKWYMTVVIDMEGEYNCGVCHEAVKRALTNRIVPGTIKLGPRGEYHLEEGWSAVCLDPYNIHAHPIMIKG